SLTVLLISHSGMSMTSTSPPTASRRPVVPIVRRMPWVIALVSVFSMAAMVPRGRAAGMERPRRFAAEAVPIPCSVAPRAPCARRRLRLPEAPSPEGLTMPRFIELSHVIENGIPGFRSTGLDGKPAAFSVHVRPMRTHAQSRPLYQDKAEFEVTEMSFQTSIGNYVDAPYVRYDK